MPRAGNPRRPGSTVIPPGWSEHHRPVAEATMTAVVLIDGPPTEERVFDKATGTWSTPPRTVLFDDVPCRIQQQRQPNESTVGDQQVSTHDYLVPVPLYVEGLVTDGSHHLLVKTCEDPDLIGRRLTVTDVMRGSLAWERDLICIDHLEH